MSVLWSAKAKKVEQYRKKTHTEAFSLLAFLFRFVKLTYFGSNFSSFQVFLVSSRILVGSLFGFFLSLRHTCGVLISSFLPTIFILFFWGVSLSQHPRRRPQPEEDGGGGGEYLEAPHNDRCRGRGGVCLPGVRALPWINGGKVGRQILFWILTF